MPCIQKAGKQFVISEGSGSFMPGFRFFCSLCCYLCFCTPLTYAQTDEPDLLSMSLEDLMEVSITSISKRTQSLSETAAAVYVIDETDIANSSAASVPDLLRTVPGLEVARIDANKWAVSARGFNGRILGRTLVFVDGRSVYVPAYASVFWEIVDLSLDDIERIEIIRGPGATSWGANAVNGVIYITTKNAKATRGGLLSLSSGNLDQALLSARYGGKLNPTSDYRVTAQLRNNQGFNTPTGLPVRDDWTDYQLGVRVDSVLSRSDQLFLNIAAYEQNINQELMNARELGKFSQRLSSPVTQSGNNLVTRWIHTYAAGQTLTGQLSYDYRSRDELHIGEHATSYDLDVYWNNNDLERHNMIIGAGARIIQHSTRGSAYISLTPAEETMEFYNISAQDDIRLSARNILGLGIKVEHNLYTGTEYQANISLNHRLSENQKVWTAYSRAYRLPSRIERHGTTVLGRMLAGELPELSLDTYFQIVPDNLHPVAAETLNSLESGWRHDFSAAFNIDLAAFYNQYAGLSSTVAADTYCSPDPLCDSTSDYLVQNLNLKNNDKAATWGLEFAASWSVSRVLDLELSYSLVNVDVQVADNNLARLEIGSLSFERPDPLSKTSLQLDWKLGAAGKLNSVLRYVSSPGIRNISSYTVLDLQYSHKINKHLNIALAARNLGSGEGHQEFDEFVVASNPALIEAA